MKLITLIHPIKDFADLATVCGPADTLLLRQDAVYLAQRTDINWPCQQVSALSADIAMRKIKAVNGITLVDDTEWVQLAASASQVLLWR